MPPLVGHVVAPLLRDCLRRCIRFCWLTSGSCAYPSRRGAAKPFLRDRIAWSGYMHQSDRESRQVAREQRVHGRSTRSASESRSDLGCQTFPGSLPLRARATGAFLGALPQTWSVHAPRGAFGHLAG